MIASTFTVLSFSLLTTYLILCRYFRFRRLKSILLKYDRGELDYRQAQDIVRLSATFESPYVVTTALSFALFRTYGIPSIARVLAHTSQLSQMEYAGRRAEDTSVLLNECLLHELDSHRGRMSLARINYLHSLYKNRITNDDMLFTLSLFIAQPIRWLKEYDWRSLAALEEQARFVYFKELGIRMGIENIPSTLPELNRWANEYEEKYMVYSKDNQLCGEATLALMFTKYPKFMHGFVRKALLVLVDERLRRSMGFEKTPVWMTWLITTLVGIRAFLLRYCSLPRIFPDDYGQGPMTCPMNKSGRYQRTKYLFEPWYVKENWSTKLFAWLRNKEGVDYQSEGFKVEEVGPKKLAGQGIETMERYAEQMKQRALNEVDTY